MARVPYLTQADLPDEYEQLFETDDEDSADVILNIHRALANNPALLEPWGTWATTIYEEIGDSRRRELVILAVARVSDCPYVWHAHVPLARESGIDDEEILAIAEGEYGEFSGPEHAAISYAVDGGEIRENGRVQNARVGWNSVRRHSDSDPSSPASSVSA